MKQSIKSSHRFDEIAALLVGVEGEEAEEGDEYQDGNPIEPDGALRVGLLAHAADEGEGEAADKCHNKKSSRRWVHAIFLYYINKSSTS